MTKASSAKQPHTDMTPDHWIERQLQPHLWPYARLMRLDRPIGTWLLLWPCLWSLVLAGPDGIPDFWYMLLFAVGSVVMRGAGCVVNDLYDRKIDGKVERTRQRPLANGSVSVQAALGFLAALLLAGLLILLQFNALTVWIGIASLALFFTYPLAKRVTWWPQLVLGFTFNWGALVGWTVVRDEINAPAFLLYAAGIFWTLAYDTIYAHQDKADDALIGVKSLALYLGKAARQWIDGFFAISIALLVVAGYAAGEGIGFYVTLPLIVAHAAWQLSTWEPDDPANCLRRFRSNRDFGTLVFLAIWLGKII